MLKAGKHVLCEKPAALNPLQAEEMSLAAKAAGAFLMEGMWMRLQPVHRAIAEWQKDEGHENNIGEPVQVMGWIILGCCCCCCSAAAIAGVALIVDNDIEQTMQNQSKSKLPPIIFLRPVPLQAIVNFGRRIDWPRFRAAEAGGGTVLEFGVYGVYLAQGIFGGRPEAVMAAGHINQQV